MVTFFLKKLNRYKKWYVFRFLALCHLDRSGEILAYNDGQTDMIVADIEVDDGYRKWNGGCFRQVNWRQRRPHLYDAFLSPSPSALLRLSAGSVEELDIV